MFAKGITSIFLFRKVEFEVLVADKVMYPPSVEHLAFVAKLPLSGRMEIHVLQTNNIFLLLIA